MDQQHSFILHNRLAWEERARRRVRHTRTASKEELRDPLKHLDPEGWLGGSISDQSVLCLGAGGGMQGALCAAAGAKVTVVDISSEMLQLDREVAAGNGFKIQTLNASLDNLADLSPGQFELVLQPVSSCYLSDIRKVYREAARVLIPGGLYISQHKQPANLQAGAAPSPQRTYSLLEQYYRTGPLPPIPCTAIHREGDTYEFLHTWEDLIGGLCQSSFVIEDLIEPRHDDWKAAPGTFAHRSLYLPPYVKIKARSRMRSESERGKTI